MDRIKFQVNGVECSVGSEVCSTTSLLEYLRGTLELRGTKYMCLEAGCGACIVTASKNGEVPQGVNSCMVSVMSCQDWDITTIEKIGNRLDKYHPIQETLAETNGSQCGYCSPGWVMAMYNLLKSKKLTMLEIEESFGSNICRCTGYRPILEAFKKFASDAPNPRELPDIEDLKICDKTGEACSKEKCEESDWCFVPKTEISNKVISIKLHDNKEWYRVKTLSDIFDIWHRSGVQSYMLVAGNTGKGVFPILEYPKILIDISGVSELKGYSIDQNLIIGAGNTITNVVNIFTKMSNYDSFDYLKILNDHLKSVAHITLKNLGTLAGNLMLKNQHHEFKSDIYLLLETVGAQVTILSAPNDSRTLTMQDFLKEDMTGKIILNILLPPLSNAHKIVTFKIMPRSQNAHAIVNAGFNYKINEAGVVLDCRIVYGGLSPVFTRAWKTENVLKGKELFRNETLQVALKVLKAELVVTQKLPEPAVEYRKQMALSLFYKGLLSLYPLNNMNSRYKSGSVKIHETRPVSSGKQIFTTNPTIWPLNKPFPKLDALIQCAGEAKYTEDLPSIQGEVFAVFVLSTVARGNIDNIDPSKALMDPGVIAFYSASDIPGVNNFTPFVNIFYTQKEELLCDGEVKYFNQPIGIIVAESQKLAEKAATLVEVKYSNVRAPQIDIKEAITDPAKVTLARSFTATKIGTDVAKVIKGNNTIHGQYNFCMETLVCVTHPTEQGLVVYAATQFMDLVHRTVSQVLNLDQNRIDVFVRRLGGAYGYKVSRSSQICGACSLVAFKLNRACRFIQPLTHNMRAIGKRTPCTSNFEVGVDVQGKVQYLNHDLYEDNGYIVNEPLILLGADLYSNVYNNEAWNHQSSNAITDTASNTWVRSLASTLDHIAMTESLMERIAYEMNLDPLEVRLTNLDLVQHSSLKEMLDTLIVNSQYAERKIAVDKFNTENRWKKRGLRFSFLRWAPVGSMYFDITLSVYRDDGTVSITHGGVEMGQGINTRAIQICAYILKIPVEKVQIKPNETMVTPNSYATAGSLASHNVGIGVQKCCEELLERLEPARSQLVDPTWKELTQRAFEMDIDLQVHAFVNTSDLQIYDLYGVTLAEVEIDVLTGEWEIIRVDLSEDVGRSVNPDLDVGQVEGAFIMGVGYWTTERLVYETTGEILTDRTWDYWVPQARDIPQDFRIYFKRDSYSTDIILGAKATGEPATCMGIVIAFAMRAAIAAARSESGFPSTEWFQIDGPYTVDKIAYFCKNKLEDFKFC